MEREESSTRGDRHAPTVPSGVVGAHTGVQPVLDYAALDLVLTAPDSIATDQPVPITLTVRNSSARPIYLGTGDSTTTFDIQVTDAGGAKVWNRMHSFEVIPLVLLERTLEPGQAVSYAETWSQRNNDGKLIRPGVYSIQGTLDTISREPECKVGVSSCF